MPKLNENLFCLTYEDFEKNVNRCEICFPKAYRYSIPDSIYYMKMLSTTIVNAKIKAYQHSILGYIYCITMQSTTIVNAKIKSKLSTDTH